MLKSALMAFLGELLFGRKRVEKLSPKQALENLEKTEETILKGFSDPNSTPTRLQHFSEEVDRYNIDFKNCMGQATVKESDAIIDRMMKHGEEIPGYRELSLREDPIWPLFNEAYKKYADATSVSLQKPLSSTEKKAQYLTRLTSLRDRAVKKDKTAK